MKNGQRRLRRNSHCGGVCFPWTALLLAVMFGLMLFTGCVREETAAPEIKESSAEEGSAEGNSEETGPGISSIADIREEPGSENAETPQEPLIPEEIEEENPIRARIAAMTDEELAAQIFFLDPDVLAGKEGMTEVTPEFLEQLCRYPVGGLVFFQENLQSDEQVKRLLTAIRAFEEEEQRIPLFFGIDEEGGPVMRIGGRAGFDVPSVPGQAEIGLSGDPSAAYETGRTIGSYLKAFGFTLDFAPVADVAVPGGTAGIAGRSFGSDPMLVSVLVAEEVRGLQDAGVMSVLKHFPGHGSAVSDSHSGGAVSYRTREELEQDLLPFQAGIEAGADFVMAGHQSYPEITGDTVPASMSSYFLTDILREKMGFPGIVLTDALEMGAIRDAYSPGDACVKALLAGADMLLMPGDFQEGYETVLTALEDETLSRERLESSVERILRVKDLYLSGSADKMRAEQESKPE